MRTTDIRQMTAEELQTRLGETVQELENLHFQQATAQLENPLQIRLIKKDIARLRTVLREIELGITREK